MKRALAAGLALVVAVGLAGCSGSSTGSPSTSGAAPHAWTPHISGSLVETAGRRVAVSSREARVVRPAYSLYPIQ